MNHLLKNPHVTALITVFFWSTTFIATKLLLVDFSPTAILLVRFIIGLAALSVISKFSLVHYRLWQHLYLMAAGITGVCFYFFLENIALSYTSTSNVAVIVSISPLFIGLASAFVYQTKLKVTFFIGFLLSFIGIFLISFAGDLSFHPLGDFLAVAAALMWMIYSLLIKKNRQLGVLSNRYDESNLSLWDSLYFATVCIDQEFATIRKIASNRQLVLPNVSWLRCFRVVLCPLELYR